MEPDTNYWLLWTIYLSASVVFLIAFWRLTRFSRLRWLSYLLRAVTIALVLTPSYANQQDTVLAPALMVLMLDAITIGGDAAVRSVVPLFLALILALIVAFVWYLIATRRRNKILKKQQVKS